MKSLEELQRGQIDRLHGMLEARRIENDALREAVAAKEVELREWQALAVELGAFAAVTKDKDRMAMQCSLMIDAGLLAAAGDRRSLIASLLHEKVLRPMLAECERSFGPSPLTTNGRPDD